MFDELLRQVRRLESTRLTVSLPVDDEGYLDRRCPAPECGADFKVLFEDWKEKATDEEVFCPICREVAPATEWNTPDQSDYVRSIGVAHVQKLIGKAMETDARRFNAQQPRSGFLTITMSVKPGARPLIVPVQAAALLRQRFTCDACACRYSALGAAFFCPACGHNSAINTFDKAVETVRHALAGIPTVRSAMATTFDEDAAENVVRELLENSVSRLVGAFQRVAEARFEQLPNQALFPRRRNVFQNLVESSALWRNATGKGYEDLLSPPEMADLSRLFQQRHLLEHREGIVDQAYIDRSGDSAYAVGQRLVIRENAVLRLADLVSKLTGELRKL